VGALEALDFINHGKLRKLSEQSLIDCSHEDVNEGCKGGDPLLAFKHVVKKGIPL